MTKLTATFQSIRTGLASLLVGKSWKTAWARGDDGYSTGTATITKPYEQSAWVFRAIQLVAAPLQSVPIKFKNAVTHEMDSDKGVADFWSRPSTGCDGSVSRADFIEASVVWMQLTGQVFWLLDDTWLTRSKEKSRIIIARPDRMRAIKRGQELLGWEYTDAMGVRALLLPQQVMRPRFFNPDDDTAGLSPYGAARIAAESDYAAGIFSKNLMEANGDRGVYVVAKGGAPSDEQRTQIEMALRQKQALNRKGIFKPMFLTGDVSVEDPKLQSADAAFVAQRLENRHEIYIAFGVPASMAQVTASYSVGSASDRFRLIEDTCAPIGAKLAEYIERIEQLRSGRNLSAEFDWSKHSVMRQVLEERTKCAVELWKTGVPMKVLNDYLDLGLPQYDGWDKSYINLSKAGSVTPAKDVPGAGKQPTEKPSTDAPTTDEPSPDDEDDLGKKMHRNFSDLATLLQSRASAITSKTDDARVALWNRHMKLQGASVKRIKAQFNKALAEARKETLQNLEATKTLDEVRKRGILDIIFNLADFTLRMTTLIKGALEDTLTEATTEFLDEIGSDDPWKMEDPRVAEFLDERENLLKDSAKEVWEQVQETIQDSINDGDSNAKMAGKLKDEFNGISKERAETIAQTETTIAYNRARAAAIVGVGIEYKEWLTAQDEKVRLSHKHVDGQVIPIADTFDVDGEKMLHPGDPSASAANVINCRCIILAARKPKD